MILLIDQGNSRIKYALWNGSALHNVSSGQLADLSAFINDAGNCTRALVSSVCDQGTKDELSTKLQELGLKAEFATTQISNHGLNNSYQHVERMGIDRWLAMLALWAATQKGFILIDAGSALTLDWVDNSGKHQGGHILPGLMMMQRSLLQQTARVRFEPSSDNQSTKLGSDTESAVQNGCFAALSAYVTDITTNILSRQECEVFITGGDGDLIASQLHINSKQMNHLVLDGLRYYFDV